MKLIIRIFDVVSNADHQIAFLHLLAYLHQHKGQFRKTPTFELGVHIQVLREVVPPDGEGDFKSANSEGLPLLVDDVPLGVIPDLVVDHLGRVVGGLDVHLRRRHGREAGHTGGRRAR